MKRHVALRPLSEEHHHTLVHARRLTRAAAGKGDAATTACAFLRFARGEMAAHFRDEEETVLPEFARWAADHSALTSRIAADHLALRVLVLSLERATIEGAPLNDLLGQIGDRLEKHVRYEERVVFPAVEAMVPGERLAAVGVLLAAGLPQ